jgi:hypothetical protein
MKKLKTLFKWILISIVLQTAVLAYLNYVYLPNRGHFRSTMYETELPAVKNRSVRLPEGASDISVSYDGLYAAYKMGRRLEIADIDKKKIIRKLEPSGGEFTYFRWLPDREMLIFAEKEPEGKSSSVRISTYDIVPELNRSYPDIEKLPEGSGVIDIELSPLTNIVYPMIQTSDTRARVYKFDIMDNLKLIFKTDLTTIIKETMYTDNLIYQPAGERIRIMNGRTGKVTYAPVKEADLLLAVDDNDIIYAAVTDDTGNVTAVWYGKAGSKSDAWEKASLSAPVLPDDIFITAGGEVFAADRSSGTIKCIKGGRDLLEYDGELLTVLDDYLVTLDGGKLVLRALTN